MWIAAALIIIAVDKVGLWSNKMMEKSFFSEIFSGPNNDPMIWAEKLALEELRLKLWSYLPLLWFSCHQMSCIFWESDVWSHNA